METKSKNPITEANKRWQSKNKERAKYLSDRSRARNFLKKRILKEDFEEFKQIIEDKELEFKIFNEEQKNK